MDPELDQLSLEGSEIGLKWSQSATQLIQKESRKERTGEMNRKHYYDFLNKSTEPNQLGAWGKKKNVCSDVHFNVFFSF